MKKLLSDQEIEPTVFGILRINIYRFIHINSKITEKF